MALTLLSIPPQQASYSVTPGQETNSIKLNGGASRYRRDIIGATSIVNVQWVVGPDKYEYLLIFYKTITASASLPFNIDLLLDRPYLTRHKAFFIENSFGLSAQSGFTYTINAQLEVYPLEALGTDTDFIYMMNEFNGEFYKYEDILDHVVNVDWPRAL